MEIIGTNAINASSGNVANAIATATLPGVVGRTTFLSGFSVVGSGVTTAAAPVLITITGLIGGTLTYVLCPVAGVFLQNLLIDRNFRPGIPASAPNTAIVITCPALGAGNTNNVANLQGYQV